MPHSDSRTTAYNPRAHWSEDDLERTLAANRDRIFDMQRKLAALTEDQVGVLAEIARRTAMTDPTHAADPPRLNWRT